MNLALNVVNFNKVNNYKTNFKESQSKKSGFAQLENVRPKAVSFGTAKAKIIENKLNFLVEKYAFGQNPLIKNIKQHFINQLSQKLVEIKRPLIVGVTGQSASGKSTLLKEAKNATEGIEHGIEIIRGDNFYHDTSHMTFEELFKSGYSFDKPEAVDLNLLNTKLMKLRQNQPVKIPRYEMQTCKSHPDEKIVHPSRIIIVDSLFSLRPELKESLDVGIYVDCSPETIKKRWFERAARRHVVGDIAESQFADVAQKAQQYVIPTAKQADLILNGEAKKADFKNFFEDIRNIFLSKSLDIQS